MSDRPRLSQCVVEARKPSGNGHDTTTALPDRVVIGARNMTICGFCRNSLREVCLTECAPAKTYFKLEPLSLENIPFLPSLPRYAETLRWSASEKWALTFLVMYYLVAQEKERR